MDVVASLDVVQLRLGLFDDGKNSLEFRILSTVSFTPCIVSGIQG